MKRLIKSKKLIKAKKLIKSKMTPEDLEKIQQAKEFFKDLQAEYENSSMSFQIKAKEIYNILSDDMIKNNTIKTNLCDSVVNIFNANSEECEDVIDNALTSLDKMENSLKEKLNI